MAIEQNKNFPTTTGPKKDKRQMKCTPRHLHRGNALEIKEVEKVNLIYI